jgi:two-component system, chemotaxis family, protein-glutamate methylesterase/glutaminase
MLPMMENKPSIKRKIKVLIIDDSLMFRESLARGIEVDPAITVVGTAPDPFKARDMILDLEPDVLTLDIEMPRMNGIEFLRQLMPQYPIPVVVVSSLSDNVFNALNAGAVDFVVKPDSSLTKGLEVMISELIVKVKIASIAKIGPNKSGRVMDGTLRHPPINKGQSILAIGASTGGTEAIYNVLKMCPEDMPPTVVVQHMPPVFTRMYAERLNGSLKMSVKEATHGDMLKPGLVLIAPGDHQMKLIKNGQHYYVDVRKGEKVNGHCPSVDVLFDSVAKLMGPNAIGVILTGMGGDGAKGLLSMRKSGARTIGQDEQSCVVYGMPKVAYDIGAVEKQTSLLEIPRMIFALLNDQLTRSGGGN